MSNTHFYDYIASTNPASDEQWYAIPKPGQYQDPVTIRLTKDMLQQIDGAAKQNRISRAAFIRLALCRSLRYHQEVEDSKRRTKH
jgi:hypothetical protein